MIQVEYALKEISGQRSEAVVVTTMMTSREWPRVTTRPDLDFPVLDCMGKASSVGLGYALARPADKTIVLDGDGSLLMNLGSLVSIAAAKPKNLLHFVFLNGIYEMSGGQPIPGLGTFDFVQLALAAGYAGADLVSDKADLAHMVSQAMAASGPTMLVLEVTPCAEDAGRPKRTTREAATELRARSIGSDSGAKGCWL